MRRSRLTNVNEATTTTVDDTEGMLRTAAPGAQDSSTTAGGVISSSQAPVQTPESSQHATTLGRRNPIYCRATIMSAPAGILRVPLLISASQSGGNILNSFYRPAKSASHLTSFLKDCPDLDSEIHYHPSTYTHHFK